MTIKEIDETLEEGQSLKAIAQAYSEIANLKIKRIRSEVERNRLFFDEISTVYSMVKAYALKRKKAMIKPKQRLALLLTSNNRFYGNINNSLIKYFILSTKELKDTDRVILGKAGINFFRAAKILPSFSELMFKQDMPTSLELNDLVRLSLEYNQVLVFHTKFKSLLIQQATFTDVSDIRAKNENDTPNFLFEPELIKILQFFDSQVLTLLLEQTFLESELSRTASRFISMDQAETEANKFIKQYTNLKAYTKKDIINKTILENFASMMALRKERYA